MNVALALSVLSASVEMFDILYVLGKNAHPDSDSLQLHWVE